MTALVDEAEADPPTEALVWAVPEDLRLAAVEPPSALDVPNPVALYLVTLADASRGTQRSGLDTVARMLSGPAATWQSLPWTSLRYPHVQALRALLVQQVRDRLRHPATANRWLGAVRSVLKEAWIAGQYPGEEYQRITQHVDPVPGHTAPAGRALELDEIAGLLDACDADLSAAGPRDAALVALLYGAGLRRAEARDLRLVDVRGDVTEIRVHGKFSKERDVPLNDAARDRMIAWTTARSLARRAPEASEERLLVPVHRYGRVRFTGRPMAGNSLRERLQVRASQAGITEPFSPHDLRRSYITHMLDAGVDLPLVQRIVGHAHADTTSRYDRRQFGKMRAAAQRLPWPGRQG